LQPKKVVTKVDLLSFILKTQKWGNQEK
jgi:hypothetical protein